MGHRVASVTLAILALIAPVGTAARPGRDAQTTAATPPKLVVILVVDQMRADYVDRFQSDWTSGLKRLVTQGAWFSQAAYPYLTTDTCAGHATVATGAFPHVHGIIQNTWWDREPRKRTACTEDPRTFDIGYGAPVRGGDSAHRLRVPTFADRLRTERAAHVVSLSLKDRSAVMLAGHGADAATWLSYTSDAWITSSAYAARPVPAVQEFTESNPIALDYGKTWSRLLPASRYEGPDDGLAEAPPRGWTQTFPHALTGIGDKPDASFLAQWEPSPFADEYVGRFAAALVESMQLGRHEGTDVLSVGFSSSDLVGHAFGPRSHEVQDMFAHLDRTIGALFEQRGDEYASLVGKDADFEPGLSTIFGDKYVTLVNGNDVYFEPGVYAELQESPAILDAVLVAIAATPGIQKVFRGEEVNGAATAADPLLRAAALSYFPGRKERRVQPPPQGSGEPGRSLQREVRALAQTSANELNGEISPDGRWLAYQSNESGQRNEIYVRPFPNVTAGKWQTSAGGGTHPLWARNGQELFYLAPPPRPGNIVLMSVRVERGATCWQRRNRRRRCPPRRWP